MNCDICVFFVCYIIQIEKAYHILSFLNNGRNHNIEYYEQENIIRNA